MITEKLNHEDAEINSNKSIVGRSLLCIALLFLFLWATFYGISSIALNHLIQYLNYLFTVMASNSSVVASIASFPSSLYMAQKYFNLEKNFKSLLFVLSVNHYMNTKIALKNHNLMFVQKFVCIYHIAIILTDHSKNHVVKNCLKKLYLNLTRNTIHLKHTVTIQ